MAILYCALTTADVIGAYDITNETSVAGRYDSNWAPSYIQMPNYRKFNLTIPTKTNIWMHWTDHMPREPSTGADGFELRVYGDDGAYIATIDTKDNRHEWYASLNGSSWTVLSNREYYDTQLNTVTYDVNIRFNDGASGNIEIDVYMDGAMRENYSGTLSSHPSTGVASIAFNNNDTIGNRSVTEIIIADEDTRGMRLTEMTPNAAGNYTAWTGDYTDFVEAAGGTGISSNTNGDRESWGLTSPIQTGEIAGARVVHQVFGYPGSSGVSQIDGFVRISSTDYDSGAQTPSPGIPLIFEWTQNPATSAAWTQTELQALEVGVEAVT